MVKDLKVGDLVAVVPVATDESGDEFDVAEAYVPEEVKGSLSAAETYSTRLNNEKKTVNVTVGGTKYNVAQWSKDLVDIDGDAVKVTRKDVTLYLDSMGNAMLAKDVGSTEDFIIFPAHGGVQLFLPRSFYMTNQKEAFAMTQTENYKLNQWERSDRILMEDFNADNARLEAALGKKLEFVELMDVTETLGNEKFWNVYLTFKLYDYVAVFLEYTLLHVSIVYFTPHSNTLIDTVQMAPPAASIACFPLRNPDGAVGFVPTGNEIEFSKRIQAFYKNIDCFSIHSITNEPVLTGTYRLRVTALR